MITKDEFDQLVALYEKANIRMINGGGNFMQGFRHNDEGQKEVERQHGISYYAYWLIGSYAGLSFDGLNAQLRDEHWVPCDEPFEKHKACLNTAMDELPPLNKKEVFRWDNMPEEGHNYIKKFVGKVIMIPQFWSTSLSKLPASNTFFKIFTSGSSNARYIAEVVDKLVEQEVLFKAPTYFLVWGYDSDTIYLKETEPAEPDLTLHYHFWEEKHYTSRVFEKLFPDTKIPKRKGWENLRDF